MSSAIVWTAPLPSQRERTRSHFRRTTVLLLPPLRIVRYCPPSAVAEMEEVSAGGALGRLGKLPKLKLLLPNPLSSGAVLNEEEVEEGREEKDEEDCWPSEKGAVVKAE